MKFMWLWMVAIFFLNSLCVLRRKADTVAGRFDFFLQGEERSEELRLERRSGLNRRPFFEPWLEPVDERPL